MSVVSEKKVLDENSSKKILEYLKRSCYAEKELRRLYWQMDPELKVTAKIREQVIILLLDRKVGPIANHLYRQWERVEDPDYKTTPLEIKARKPKIKSDKDLSKPRRNFCKCSSDDLRKKMFQMM